MDVAEGDLKYALKHDRVNRASHDVYGMVPPNLLGQLRQSSKARVEKDEEFIDLLRRVEMYVKQKEQDSISLEQEKFMHAAKSWMLRSKNRKSSWIRSPVTTRSSETRFTTAK